MSLVPTEKQFLNARRSVVDDIKNSVIGNDWRSDEEKELNFNPLYHFISGILYPLDQSNKGFFEANEDELNENDIEIDDLAEDDIDTNVNNKSSNFPEEEEDHSKDHLNIIDQSSQYKQSSFGLNFITSENEEIEIKVGFSKYTKDKKKENNRTKYIYIQEKTKDIFKFKITSSALHQKKQVAENLLLRLDSRFIGNNLISTVSLSNQKEQSDDNKYELSDCYFQVGIEIKTLKKKFLPIKTPLQAGSSEEAASLDLLFRKKLSYATGNGCATDWEEGSECKKIWTEFLPSYEIKSIEPSSGIDLRMETLANIDNKQSNQDAYLSIQILINEYEEWIQKQEKEKDSLSSQKHIETAERHITSAKIWLERMANGFDLIKDDENASMAFRLANFAMLIQANRLDLLERKKSFESLKFKNGSSEKCNCTQEELNEDFTFNKHNKITYSWRPFQLAFVLGIIPDIVKKENKYRDQVDLIWFPTGGGKTEAYLGALAFSIIHRRLLDSNDNGITALMRYTLRLLTADQFRRSSALICAIDYIRKEKILDVDLGSKNISIGLWIGRKASPATHEEAYKDLRSNKLDVNGNQAFMLDECPWCKSHLTDPNDSGYEYSLGKVFIRCPDSNCHFNESIPVYLWQESIFDEKPTLLLGTIDNFCKLAWMPETIDLFNDPNKSISPPDLIIQDELHLISGPLGSLVGLYETVLLKIFERNGIGPKIIGATATLSLEGSQSKNLYRGKNSAIFPPQVLNWGDSYFAKEAEDKFGRLYLGFFGSSKGSMVESAFSASIPALQAPNKILPSLEIKGEKGDSKLIIKDRALSNNSGFSYYHSGVYAEYKITKVKDVDDGTQIISIEPPLIDNIIEGGAIYPIPDSNDMAFDPYGTLVWYFNSKRELAYISNQINRMIDSLKSNARYQKFKILGSEKAPSRFARKIRNVKELTGRLPQDEIQSIIANLRMPWTQVLTHKFQKRGIDILFSTNMISVGVDIPRLGQMIVHGHPRTTAEYIQATSRVGRRYPGLVTTVYNHSKSKDRSIYEMFKNYHQSIYRYVESVSVTPFASGARDRALPAIFVSLARYFGVNNPSISQSNKNDMDALKKAKEWILETIELVDAEEFKNTEIEIDKIIKKWVNRIPTSWGKMYGMGSEEVKLLGVLGEPDTEYTIFKAPTSMRSVDAGVNVSLHSGYETIEAQDEY